MNDVSTGKGRAETAPPQEEDPHHGLRKLELTAILGRMSKQERESAELSLWGLALSGGGIRKPADIRARCSAGTG